METKVVSFEQMPELIQNLVERIEALEKTVREKQQPQPLEGELMSVEDVCKMLGKSKSAVYRTVRCQDIPFIRQGNRLYFDRPTIKKWLEKKQNIECIRQMDEFEKFMTPRPMALPKSTITVCVLLISVLLRRFRPSFFYYIL